VGEWVDHFPERHPVFLFVFIFDDHDRLCMLSTPPPFPFFHSSLALSIWLLDFNFKVFSDHEALLASAFINVPVF